MQTNLGASEVTLVQETELHQVELKTMYYVSPNRPSFRLMEVTLVGLLRQPRTVWSQMVSSTLISSREILARIKSVI